MRLVAQLAALAIGMIFSVSIGWAASIDDVAGAPAVVAAAKTRKTIRIIARLRTPSGAAAMSAAAIGQQVSAVTQVMRAAGLARVDTISGLPMVVVEVDAAQLDTLVRSGLVEAIQEDKLMPPALAESVSLVDTPAAWATGARGAGWSVAILDSGVQTDHPFLSGRIAAEGCFSTTSSAYGSTSVCPSGQDQQTGTGAGVNCPLSLKGCTHGTHVAGIAAGHNYPGGPGYNGVAPDATIIAVQVFSSFSGSACGGSGSCVLSFTSDRIRALQFVASLTSVMKVASVNISIGSGLYTSACDDSLEKQPIDNLRTIGVATVIAAGNDGSGSAVSNPGCISTAVTVGATTDHDAIAVASFSNSAPMVDVLAPGVSIDSSVPVSSYSNFQGTSMATPHVTGAYAVLRSGTSGKTVDQIEQALESTGRNVTDLKNGLVEPLIDIYDACLELGGCGGSISVPGWSSWASRGGSLGSFPDCQLVGSKINCWAASSAGHLIWNQTIDGGGWSGWVDLGGSVLAAPSCLVRGSRIDCFVATTASQLAQITYNGSSWSGWTNLKMPTNGRPSCVAATGLNLDCFSVGPDKAFYHITNNGTKWMPFEKLGGKFGTRPECVRHSGGDDCFVVDTSKTLQTRRLAKGKWTAWSKIGTGFGLSPQCIVNDVKMDCFAQGSSQQLLKGYYNGKKWSAWTGVGSTAVISAPYCTQLSDGFDCFWTNGASKLIERRRQGSAWNAEKMLDGASVQQRPVCLAQNGGARIDCLVRGTDNTLEQETYLSSGSSRARRQQTAAASAHP